MFGETKNTRSRITQLRLGCDGADFDEAKAKRCPCRQCDAVLIEPGGKPDWVWEIQTEKCFRPGRWLKNFQGAQRKIDM